MLRRAKRKRIKRIIKASFFALVMTAFSATLYLSTVKNVKVNYLGNEIVFKTMAKTVKDAFAEKSIIISDGLVVSKDLDAKLSRNEKIFIDAPAVLAMAEPVKEVMNVTETKQEEVKIEEPVKEEAPKQEEKKETATTTEKSTTTTKTTTSKTTTSRAKTSKKVWYDPVKEVEPGVIETADGTLLEYTDVLELEATAYCACYSCCGKYPSNKYYGITKTGTRAKVGTIAVDPKVIPLGTEVYIEGLGGAKNYGKGKAEDIGGAIKGNIIDLYFDTHAETIQWGRQQVKVYILK